MSGRPVAARRSMEGSKNDPEPKHLAVWLAPWHGASSPSRHLVAIKGHFRGAVKRLGRRGGNEVRICAALGRPAQQTGSSLPENAATRSNRQLCLCDPATLDGGVVQRDCFARNRRR